MTPAYSFGEKVIYQDRIHTVMPPPEWSEGYFLKSLSGTIIANVPASLIAPLVKDEEMKSYKELRTKMGDYTEADLVSFGNYMLKSDRRGVRPRVRSVVNDTDLDKWRHSRKV